MQLVASHSIPFHGPKPHSVKCINISSIYSFTKSFNSSSSSQMICHILPEQNITTIYFSQCIDGIYLHSLLYSRILSIHPVFFNNASFRNQGSFVRLTSIFANAALLSISVFNLPHLSLYVQPAAYMDAVSIFWKYTVQNHPIHTKMTSILRTCDVFFENLILFGEEDSDILTTLHKLNYQPVVCLLYLVFHIRIPSFYRIFELSQSFAEKSIPITLPLSPVLSGNKTSRYQLPTPSPKLYLLPLYHRHIGEQSAPTPPLPSASTSLSLSMAAITSL